MGGEDKPSQKCAPNCYITVWSGGGKTVKVVKIPRFPSVSKRPGLDSFDLTYWWGAVLPSLVWVGGVAPDPARIIVRVPGEGEAAWKEREREEP